MSNDTKYVVELDPELGQLLQEVADAEGVTLKDVAHGFIVFGMHQMEQQAQEGQEVEFELEEDNEQ